MLPNGTPLPSNRVLFVRFVPMMFNGEEEVSRRKPRHLLSYVGADAGRVSVVHSTINPSFENLRQRV